MPVAAGFVLEALNVSKCTPREGGMLRRLLCSVLSLYLHRRRWTEFTTVVRVQSLRCESLTLGLHLHHPLYYVAVHDLLVSKQS